MMTIGRPCACGSSVRASIKPAPQLRRVPVSRSLPPRVESSADSSPWTCTSPAQAAIAVATAAALVLTIPAGPAEATGSQKVGEFQASGFLFKDSVELTAVDDPDIQGLTVYVSEFKRSIVDKLAKDFFSEPSQLFSESKGLNLFRNKTLRIRRLYDPARNVVTYVAYSTRLSNAADDGGVSSGRYRTSTCAVSLGTVTTAPELASAAAAAASN